MTTQPRAAAPAPFTVGFDLDMTLIDSRPGIRVTYEALAAETGVPIDAELAVGRLGPPLVQELREWFPEEDVPRVADRYRELYQDLAITGSLPMPGAREALAVVRELGGRSIVVTAKHGGNARLHLDHLALEPDALIGDLWAEQKAVALRDHGAGIYVGDHTGDVRGAHAAGALSVAVATGPCPADELRAAGADVVLAGLEDFPRWLRAHRARADEEAAASA
ncbi:HAD family hydrolase [Streptomyces sp. I05A-00742]|uniref:HAD family hydrolase n=1 Tax=Streptomyces sp. I05A-00742 TaxID=2732853 RepID=UPI001488BC66|nr:HAD family hydrolase [Streptomyces sp. I05A-00742]